MGDEMTDLCRNCGYPRFISNNPEGYIGPHCMCPWHLYSSAAEFTEDLRSVLETIAELKAERRKLREALKFGERWQGECDTLNAELTALREENAELRVGESFHKVTVQQRDAAWCEVSALQSDLTALREAAQEALDALVRSDRISGWPNNIKTVERLQAALEAK